MISSINLGDLIALSIIAIEFIAMLIVTVIDREYDV
jgi:hypothetical protein